ncbi:MAG: SCO family protein [Crocinitomicaceae bacterium]|jgi:protein SCO1|nr:SCO family protein [Crocinitomicaceae bacterium]MDG1735796.1 SCO family protein [Crocinitomicaceae bacterium]MDG2506101.1 SCO family protein [Crocinitomicaceae bacterium]
MKKVIFIFGLLFVCVPIAYYFNKPDGKKQLDIINPIDLDEDVVDPELRNKGRAHFIADFELTDQNNQQFRSKSINGKIWIVEYFFSTCKGICPIMNAEMKRVQSAYEKDINVVILSLTVDPDNDNPEVLKSYAQTHGAIKGKWFFLTGAKAKLYALARKSFFLLKPAEAKNQGDVGSDFIHTNNFVLIDKNRQIRGYYDGTNPEEVNELIEDIEILKGE